MGSQLGDCSWPLQSFVYVWTIATEGSVKKNGTGEVGYENP